MNIALTNSTQTEIDDGERKLLIIQSWAQGPSVPIMFITISVDGGLDVMLNCSGDSDNWLSKNKLKEVLLFTVTHWYKSSLPDAIVEQLTEIYHLNEVYPQ